MGGIEQGREGRLATLPASGHFQRQQRQPRRPQRRQKYPQPRKRRGPWGTNPHPSPAARQREEQEGCCPDRQQIGVSLTGGLGERRRPGCFQVDAAHLLALDIPQRPHMPVGLIGHVRPVLVVAHFYGESREPAPGVGLIEAAQVLVLDRHPCGDETGYTEHPDRPAGISHRPPERKRAAQAGVVDHRHFEVIRLGRPGRHPIEVDAMPFPGEERAIRTVDLDGSGLRLSISGEEPQQASHASLVGALVVARQAGPHVGLGREPARLLDKFQLQTRPVRFDRLERARDNHILSRIKIPLDGGEPEIPQCKDPDQQQAKHPDDGGQHVGRSMAGAWSGDGGFDHAVGGRRAGGTRGSGAFMFDSDAADEYVARTLPKHQCHAIGVCIAPIPVAPGRQPRPIFLARALHDKLFGRVIAEEGAHHILGLRTTIKRLHPEDRHIHASLEMTRQPLGVAPRDGFLHLLQDLVRLILPVERQGTQECVAQTDDQRQYTSNRKHGIGHVCHTPIRFWSVPRMR